MPDVSSLLAVVQTFSFSQLGLNGLDILILIVLLLYAVEGYAAGFFGELFDLVSFLLSFIIGLKFYSLLGPVLSQLFGLPPGFAKAGAFFLLAFISELLVMLFLRKLFFHARARIGTQLNLSDRPVSMRAVYIEWADRVFGMGLGVCSALVLLSFFLTLLLSLPFSPFLKQTIAKSKIGNRLVANTQGVEKTITNVLGGAVNETLTFLTVKPEGDETVNLRFTTTNVHVDALAEAQMLMLVNKERAKVGLEPLVMDEKLQAVARSHSRDMFARGYFSHYTPEGLSPFDRMANANITYEYAGENLALAPNVEVAMEGLMNSPGHKANILSPNFKRVGIGGIDGGIYGQMFSQEFTD